jgi:AraC family transcriptional regulator
VTHAPYAEVHANYKERIDQPYVFVECTGSYAQTGRALPGLHAALVGRGIRASGPPFGLFYDDPKTVSVAELRSRACLPVDAPVAATNDFKFDVLAQGTVAYAVVSGPYPEAPRAYPGLARYMSKMGWVQNGPIREIYLVPPSATKSHDELLCEIQIPATNPR